MTNKLRAAFLIVALIVSMVSVFSVLNSPEKAQAGIECVVGPGNCGCLLSSDYCQSQSSWTYIGTYQEGCGGSTPHTCAKWGMTIENYQNGVRYTSTKFVACRPSANCGGLPSYPWCNPYNSCGN